MFYSDEFYLLNKMLSKSHLKTAIVDPEKPIVDEIDNVFKSLFGSRDGTLLDFFPDIKEKTVYRLTDVFLCRYIFFELPTTRNRQIFIIGPYINIDISREQILEQGEKLGVSPMDLAELEMYYASIPLIREEGYIFAMVDSFAEFIWGENYDNTDISLENSVNFMPDSLEKEHQQDGLANIQFMEDRYNYENMLIRAIEQGDSHKAESMLSSFSSLAFEERTPDALRNMKNYCIITNTLFRKAAERGGVHPVYLNTVSSDFARRIENINTLSAAPAFMLEILRSYCKLVRRHSVKNHSPLVQKTIIKIETDLTGNLTLSALAKMNNVSAGYLSGVFRKETGQTLTDYVNSARIKQAKHLLKTTSLQVQTVALHCGVLDFHYFCRIFKKLTGKTPTQYRKDISFN